MSVRWDIDPNPNDERALPVVPFLQSRRKNDLLVGGGPWDGLGDPGEEGESIGEPYDASGAVLSAVLAVEFPHMDWECGTPVGVGVLPTFLDTAVSVVAVESDAVVGGADPGCELGGVRASLSCTADMERDGSIDVLIPNPNLRTSRSCEGEARADESSCVAATREAEDEGFKLMLPPRAPRARENSKFSADGLRVGVVAAPESP